MAFDLSNYVDVATRIKMLYELHPHATIWCESPKVVEIAGHHFIEVTATVEIPATDTVNARTSKASAWEPFPGKTTYTKDSEMMNAETSAVGRAIGLLGIGLTGSMATANEVQNRQGAPAPRIVTQQGDTTITKPANMPSEKQLWLFKKLLKDAGKLPPLNIDQMDKFEVSRGIEALKNGGEIDLPPLPDEEPF